MDRNKPMARNESTATAGAGGLTLAFRREFDAPAASVFGAYTNSRLLRQWVGPRGSELRIRDFVPRTGGLYNYAIADGDRELEFFGSFHEVTETVGPDDAARIVRTVESSGRPGHPRLEVLKFTDLGKGRSRLEILTAFASVEDHDAGGTEPDMAGELHDRLDELLASPEHGAGEGFHGETSNHRPGEPLRKWDAVTASGDLALTIMGSASGDAIVRLVNGNPLSSEDLIAFGRLNSLCVLKWFEPLVMLLGPKGPQLAPDHAELIRVHTKLFR